MKKRKKDKDLLINEIPLTSGMWHVLYPRKGEAATKWNPVFSPLGEKLMYPIQADAEKKARELSLLNAQIYGVVGDPTAESFLIYDYGVRYIMTLDGERTRMDTAMFEVDEGENTSLYRLQTRKPHNQNNGKFTKWQSHGERDYVSLDDAWSEAALLSKGQPTKEFRVVVAGADLPPQANIYRGGQSLPDAEVLANLCRATGYSDDAKALLSLLAEWKGVEQSHSLIQALYREVTL
jgi:hypothetical protein